MRLRCIFNDKKAVLVGEFQDGIHVSHLTEKVNRNDGLCASRDYLFQTTRIHGVCVFVDVHKDRCGTAICDCFGTWP